MNEAFLESASIRDNVVKIAKQLNYTPRSIKAAKACIRFAVQTEAIGSSTIFPSQVTLEAGDVFVSSISGSSYVFTIPKAVTATVQQSDGVATFEKLRYLLLLVHQYLLLVLHLLAEVVVLPG